MTIVFHDELSNGVLEHVLKKYFFNCHVNIANFTIHNDKYHIWLPNQSFVHSETAETTAYSSRR